MSKSAKIFYIGALILYTYILVLMYKDYTNTKRLPVIKHDYYLEITQDSLYFMNKQGDTIHKEAYDDVNPTLLQKALDNDNL